MRHFVTGLLAAASVFAAALPAVAQSIILSPAVVPLAGQPGQSASQTLTLQNGTDLELEFTLEARDVEVRDGQRVFTDAGVLPDSIAANAVFTPSRVRVGPKASATVQLTLTLPPAMRHRAVVALFRGTTPVRAGNRPALLSLGTLFTFTISEHVSLAAKPLEVQLPTSSTPLQLQSRVVNDGSEPVVPSGMAVVLDAAGRLVGKAAFRPKRLLPGEAATLATDYSGELAPGAYRAVATFDVAGRPLTLTAPFAVQ